MLKLWCVVVGLISKEETTVQSAAPVGIVHNTNKVTFRNIKKEPVNVNMVVVPLLCKHDRITLKTL